MTAVETPKATKAPTPARELEAWIKEQQWGSSCGWHEVCYFRRHLRVTLPVEGTMPPDCHSGDVRGREIVVSLLPVATLGARLSAVLDEIDGLELLPRLYGIWALRKVLRESQLVAHPAFASVVEKKASPRLAWELEHLHDHARWASHRDSFEMHCLRREVLAALGDADQKYWFNRVPHEVFAGLDDAPQATTATTPATTTETTPQEPAAPSAEPAPVEVDATTETTTAFNPAPRHEKMLAHLRQEGGQLRNPDSSSARGVLCDLERAGLVVRRYEKCVGGERTIWALPSQAELAAWRYRDLCRRISDLTAATLKARREGDEILWPLLDAEIVERQGELGRLQFPPCGVIEPDLQTAQVLQASPELLAPSAEDERAPILGREVAYLLGGSELLPAEDHATAREVWLDYARIVCPDLRPADEEMAGRLAQRWGYPRDEVAVKNCLSLARQFSQPRLPAYEDAVLVEAPKPSAPQVQPPQELRSQLDQLVSAAQDFANALRDQLIMGRLISGPTSQEIEKRLAELRVLLDDPASQEDQAPAPAPALTDLLKPSPPVLKRCASTVRGNVCGAEAHTEEEVERLFGWRWITADVDQPKRIPQGQCKACKSALNRANAKARRSPTPALDLRQADLLEPLPPPPARPDYFARLRAVTALVVDGQHIGEGITTSRPPKLEAGDPERLVVACEAGVLRLALSPLGEWTVRAEERPKATPPQLAVWARAAAVVSVALEIDAHAHVSDGPGLSGLEWTKLIMATREKEVKL